MSLAVLTCPLSTVKVMVWPDRACLAVSLSVMVRVVVAVPSSQPLLENQVKYTSFVSVFARKPKPVTMIHFGL